MNKKRKLKFFADVPALLAYITSELLATLRDDLDKMQRSERQHYTRDDCKAMKAKIHDIESIEHRVVLVDSLTHTRDTFVRMIANLKTEEEFGDDGMSGDDAVESLCGLIRQARTYQKG